MTLLPAILRKAISGRFIRNSRVAGIVDTKGGVRIMVGTRAEIIAAVGAGERFFLVPRLRVIEPVPYEKIPSLIDQVHEHVAKVAWHRLSLRTQAVLRGPSRSALP